MTRPWRRAALAGVAALLLGGCTSFADTVAAPAPVTTSTPTSTPTSAPAGDAGTCGVRARPDPDRPRIALDFRLADDLRSVTGTETASFTPDRPVEELVFRLVPNGPDISATGSRLVVDAVRGDDVAGSGYEQLGAADPGGAYVVALDEPLAAGESTAASTARSPWP